MPDMLTGGLIEDIAPLLLAGSDRTTTMRRKLSSVSGRHRSFASGGRRMKNERE